MDFEKRLDQQIKKDDAKGKRPWRENIEALGVAIIVALTLKYFVIEVSKIPSGSMQPTLIGEPQVGVFDRVLVDKLGYRMRDPERWEIVVFKHPLENSRNMVKRLVGMPGEEFRIQNGDLFHKPTGSAEFQPLRRPENVQSAMWRELPPTGWNPRGNPVRLASGTQVLYRSPGRNSVTDHYLDGYPEGVASKLAPMYPRNMRFTEPVGDLRIQGEVEAGADCGAVTITFKEGGRSYTLTLPGPAAAESARPSIDAVETSAAEEPYRLPAGRSVAFAAENLDDRLALEIDGSRVATLEIPATSDQRGSEVSVRVSQGSAVLSDLQTFRDIHYLPGSLGARIVSIPEGSYLMLGDNTRNSADGREWEATTFTLTADGRELRGNYRKTDSPLDTNPVSSVDADGNPVQLFRDHWGERYVLAEGDAVQGVQEPWPLVTRDLIQGRVFSVFWPVKPWNDVWRFGWIR